MAKSNAASQALWKEVHAFALGLPGAYEDHPWGEIVAKVNKKVFVFLGMGTAEERPFGMSVKLPSSNDFALTLPFTEPTGYGLGKGGWVTVHFMPDELPPAEMMKEWLLESYRAVAPKKLAAALDGAPAVKSAKPTAGKTSREGASAAKPTAAKSSKAGTPAAKPRAATSTKATKAGAPAAKPTAAKSTKAGAPAAKPRAARSSKAGATTKATAKT